MSVRGWAGVGGVGGSETGIRPEVPQPVQPVPQPSQQTARCQPAAPCRATRRHATNTLAPTPELLCRASLLKGTVLAWPEPAQSTWPFWECGRYHYCSTGEDPSAESADQVQFPTLDYLDPDWGSGQGRERQPRWRAACYPAQAW